MNEQPKVLTTDNLPTLKSLLGNSEGGNNQLIFANLSSPLILPPSASGKRVFIIVNSLSFQPSGLYDTPIQDDWVFNFKDANNTSYPIPSPSSGLYYKNTVSQPTNCIVGTISFTFMLPSFTSNLTLDSIHAQFNEDFLNVNFRSLIAFII